IVGNLKELFDDIENLGAKSETVYTDKYSRTMEIRLGVPVRKDHGKYHKSNRRLCSAFGVHAGGHQYVKNFGGHGDTILLVLINPKDLTYVHVNEAKIQTSQYVPIGIMEGGEKKDWQEFPASYFELDYADQEYKEILELAKTGSLTATQKEML